MTTIIGGTWTYSGNPNSDLKDRVRFLIRDTDESDQKVSDEEILWSLSDTGNSVYSAAATCCRVIACDLAGADKVMVGDVSEQSVAGRKEWMDLADSYDLRAVTLESCPSPYVGGISVTRKLDNQRDRDLVPPRFRSGQFDNPWNRRRGDTRQGQFFFWPQWNDSES